jgi:hypothetical protein
MEQELFQFQKKIEERYKKSKLTCFLMRRRSQTINPLNVIESRVFRDASLKSSFRISNTQTVTPKLSASASV